jgi:hypothetical protein
MTEETNTGNRKRKRKLTLRQQPKAKKNHGAYPSGKYS